MKISLKIKDKYFLVVFVISMLISSVLIAIPGYYSNDELLFLSPTASFLSPSGGMDTPAAIVNRCVQLGFNLNCLHQSRFFRPLGGLILTNIMKGNLHPFWPHLLMTFLHGINVTLLYALLKEKSRNTAFLIAILFAASPLALYTVAWVAAIYDILMTMAGLAMAMAIVSYVKTGSKYSLFFAAAFTLLGLLSKETALVFPALALIIIGWSTGNPLSRRGVAALSAVSIPWLIYLFIRLRPLMHAASSSSGGYKTDIGTNVIQNLAAYIQFPFAVDLAEIANVAVMPMIVGALCLAAFSSVFILCWATKGLSLALGCLALWLLPLLPVLIITKFETQYLYAAAIGLSMALAFGISSRNKVARSLGLLLAILLTAHSVTIERSMYKTGVCQTNLINDLGSYANVSQSGQQHWPPKILPAKDAPWWVLSRLVGKWEYWHESAAPVVTQNNGAADLFMTNACHLQPAEIRD